MAPFYTQNQDQRLEQGQEQRLVRFITRTNWILLISLAVAGFIVLPADVAWGILLGGLIVTVNFHLLSKTIRNAFQPPNRPSHNVIIAKYYLRFIISGFIIFVLIWTNAVNPLGLIAGLSIVVASIFMATIGEVKRLLVKEAT